jgi:hypothetical protein
MGTGHDRRIAQQSPFQGESVAADQVTLLCYFCPGCAALAVAVEGNGSRSTDVANQDEHGQEQERTLQLMSEAAKFSAPLVKVVDETKGHFGIASAVLVRWQGVRLAFTAEHVLREKTKALVLDMPAIDHRARPTKMPEEALVAKPIFRDPAIDLLVLDARHVRHLTGLGKEDYDLTKSAKVAAESLRTSPMPSAIIYGYLGPETGVANIGGWRMFDPPPYHARGQLTLVENDRIVARFEEHAIVTRNVEAYPQLAKLKAEGASRNLKGTSGSGLWVPTPGGVVLAGLLRGPASGQIGDPDIAFTPIWVILRELAAHWKV